VLVPGRVAGLGFGVDLAGLARRAAAVVRRVVPLDFPALVRGAAAGRAGRDDLPDADLELAALADDDAVLAVRALVVPLADLAADPDLAVVADAVGLAADMALAASVSDFVAAVIALVAVFIACMAVDIVRADDVAFVAAAVILVAALVTFEAADETVRAALAAVGAFLDAVDRVVPPAAAPARLDVLLLADRVPVLLAGLRRAAVRVVVRAGTDVPPVLINYGVLFHGRR
jgi:hypothetical protein